MFCKYEPRIDSTIVTIAVVVVDDDDDEHDDDDKNSIMSLPGQFM